MPHMLGTRWEIILRNHLRTSLDLEADWDADNGARFVYVNLAYLSHIAMYLHDAVPRGRNRDVLVRSPILGVHSHSSTFLPLLPSFTSYPLSKPKYRER